MMRRYKDCHACHGSGGSLRYGREDFACHVCHGAGEVRAWRADLAAFLRGMREFRHAFTPCYANRDTMRAYDQGRELAHLLTFRRWEA